MFKTTVTFRDGLSYDYIGEDVDTELVEGVYIIRDNDNNIEIGYPVSYIASYKEDQDYEEKCVSPPVQSYTLTGDETNTSVYGAHSILQNYMNTEVDK